LGLCQLRLIARTSPEVDSYIILIEAYIGALLVDEELADLVWEAWDAGEIETSVAATAWLTVSGTSALSSTQ